MQRVTWKYKLALFCLFMAAYAVFYVFPNFHPSQHPSYLPLLDFELAIPLLPWTFLVYISDYLLIATAIAAISDPDKFRVFARFCFFTLAVCGTFFLFFPTQYPRPEYPPVTNPLVAFVMACVRELDTPNCCFPSMHVAITGTTAWCMRHKGPKIFSFYVAWSLAIFGSTLTTKQHYLIDVAGGIGVVVTVALIHWVFFEKDFLRVSQLAKALSKPRG